MSRRPSPSVGARSPQPDTAGLPQLSPPMIHPFESATDTMHRHAAQQSQRTAIHKMVSDVSRTRAQAARSQNPVALHRLPIELLLTILIDVLEQEGGVAPLSSLALVCRRWAELTRHDYVWTYVAKHHFVAFPLIRRLLLSSSWEGVTAPDWTAKVSATLAAVSESRVARAATDCGKAFVHVLGVYGQPSTAAAVVQASKSPVHHSPASPPWWPCRPTGDTPSAIADTPLPPMMMMAGEATTPLPTPPSAAASPDANPASEAAWDTATSTPLLSRAGSTVSSSSVPRRRAATTRSGASSSSQQQQQHTRVLSSGPLRPTMATIRRSQLDVKEYLHQSEHAHRVAQRRRYVLHLFLSFILLFSLLSVTCFAGAWEGIGADHGLTIDNGFKFLWATFLMVNSTVVTNIVMQAHFEPRPLMQRISRHVRLILQTIVVLSLLVGAVGLPLLRLQQLVALPASERPSALSLVEGPGIAALVWQGFVGVWFRREVWYFVARRGGPAHFSTRGLVRSIAYSAPVMLLITLVSMAMYVDGGSHLYLMVATGIPGVAFAVVALLFLLDFVARTNIIDGLASVSLLLAALCPVLLTCGVVRGLALAPLIAALLVFYVGHVRSLFALLNSVDELDVLVAAGSTYDEE